MNYHIIPHHFQSKIHALNITMEIIQINFHIIPCNFQPKLMPLSIASVVIKTTPITSLRLSHQPPPFPIKNFRVSTCFKSWHQQFRWTFTSFSHHFQPKPRAFSIKHGYGKKSETSKDRNFSHGLHLLATKEATNLLQDVKKKTAVLPATAARPCPPEARRRGETRRRPARQRRCRRKGGSRERPWGRARGGWAGWCWTPGSWAPGARGAAAGRRAASRRRSRRGRGGGSRGGRRHGQGEGWGRGRGEDGGLGRKAPSLWWVR